MNTLTLSKIMILLLSSTWLIAMTKYALFSTIYQNQDNLQISQYGKTVAEIALTGDIILEVAEWSDKKKETRDRRSIL